jgi:hypothetical protein
MRHDVTVTRRTPSQTLLYFVSVLMAVLAGLILALGVVLVVMGHASLANQQTRMGGLVACAAALLGVTAWLGMRAARDYSKAGAYRSLCYTVSLLILLVIIAGWSNGKIVIFDPVVLAATVIYVLICSSLADEVEKDYALGVKGELLVLDGTQRRLHFMGMVLLLQGVVALLLSLLAWLLGANGIAPNGAGWVSTPGIIALAITGGLLLGSGLLATFGANHPQHIGPFLVVSTAVLALEVAWTVLQLVRRDITVSELPLTFLAILFTLACVHLSRQIRDQARKDAEGKKDGAIG